MITANELKKMLISLRPEAQDFRVEFSGKQGRVDGVYKVDDMVIIIHEKNFVDADKLVYTALHEFAHHIHHTESTELKKSAHGAIFQGIFHDLLDAAELSGHYHHPGQADKDISDKIESINIKQEKIVALQKEIGEDAIELISLASDNNISADDIFDRFICVKISEIKSYIAAFQYNIKPSLCIAKTSFLSKIKDLEFLQSANRHLLNGKTIAQVKAMIWPEKFGIQKKDVGELLIKEKKRVDIAVLKSIDYSEQLEKRLIDIGVEYEA